MTKQQILDRFYDINLAYNNCNKLDDLSTMLDELLKENQGISVDAFLQWCIESHRMGDASRKGIEYWINEFKAWKQKAKDGGQE